MKKLIELIKHLDKLPQKSIEDILTHLGSSEIVKMPDNERLDVYNSLMDLVTRHKRYAGAKWAFNSDLVQKIEEVIAKLAPTNPMYLYNRLFTNRRDIILLEKNDNWDEKQIKLKERRQEAIQKILDFAGFDGTVQFAESVEAPDMVGFSLGSIAEAEIDSAILPRLLDPENNKIMFLVSGFVWGRFAQHEWKWVDGISMIGWTQSQISQFFAFLPFIDETWKRVMDLLGDKDGEYWRIVAVNPYQCKGDLYIAIDKLHIHNRPLAAIDCLSKILYDKKPLDHDRVVKILLSAASTTESINSHDIYNTIEIIKALQEDPSTNPDDLFRIEWIYLPILDEYRGASPKLLELYLASHPDFFCEVIRLVYRSKKEIKSHIESNEKNKNIVLHSYHLLRRWRTPPGTQPDGHFSETHFKQWLVSVKTQCIESGHLEVAYQHIGNVLVHSPADPDGFFINCSIAEVLNEKDADNMREGYYIAIINSRGVHGVDPEGKPELELAEKYNKLAKEVEDAGYQRFATTFKSLADSYNQEARRIIDEHKNEEGAGAP